MIRYRKCKLCRARFKLGARGRRALYCCPAHRQKAYERRRVQREIARRFPILAFRSDAVQAQLRDVIRQEIRSILKQSGYVVPSVPVTKRRPTLRLVKSDANDDHLP